MLNPWKALAASGIRRQLSFVNLIILNLVLVLSPQVRPDENMLSLVISRTPYDLILDEKNKFELQPVSFYEINPYNQTETAKVAHPMFIREPGREITQLRHFNGRHPALPGIKEYEKLEVVLSGSGEKADRYIQFPRNIEKNLLSLMVTGLDKLCQSVNPDATYYSECMGHTLFCHQLAHFLSLNDTVPLAQRFDFFERYHKYAELIFAGTTAYDNHLLKLPVVKKGQEYYLDTKNKPVETFNELTNSRFVPLPAGTRLLLFNVNEGQTPELIHSAIYLAEGYTLTKNVIHGVVAMTIEEYIDAFRFDEQKDSMVKIIAVIPKSPDNKPYEALGLSEILKISKMMRADKLVYKFLE